MHRLAVLVVVFLVVAGPARARVLTWHPQPIFTPAWCSQELGKAKAAFAAALGKAKVTRPAPDEPDQTKVAPYRAFLQAYDARIGARAAGQAAAAGAWVGETRYATVTWHRNTYRIGSCQLAKIKIPLNRALAVVAVGQPTETDQAIAESIRKLIAIKRARAACRQLRDYHDSVACRQKYHGYDWLDRYPMD